MWMVAIKEHGYNGRRLKPGEKFKTRTHADAKILRVASLARQAKKSEIPVSEFKKDLDKVMDIFESVQSEPQSKDEEIAVERREEMPEETGEEEVKPRRQRRRYKRNEMVPEE